MFVPTGIMLEREGLCLYTLTFWGTLLFGWWVGLIIFSLGYPCIFNREEYFREEELPMEDLDAYCFPSYSEDFWDTECLFYYENLAEECSVFELYDEDILVDYDYKFNF